MPKHLASPLALKSQRSHAFLSLFYNSALVSPAPTQGQTLEGGWGRMRSNKDNTEKTATVQAG